jgi:hypothetical protein
MELIKPKEIESASGTFRLSKFPATIGREILVRYPLNNLPKIMEYLDSEKEMLLLMSYVEKKCDNNMLIRLDSKVMINQHVTGNNEIGAGEELIKLEWAMMQYNFSFLSVGSLHKQWTEFLTALKESGTQILTLLSDSLSRKRLRH